MDISIAGHPLDMDAAQQQLAAYPQATIAWYDHGGGARSPANEVVLSDIGRMCVINADLQGNDSVALLRLGATAPWELVPPGVDLEDADPEEEGGLYDAAATLYSHFTAHPGIGNAKASKLLHLKRPMLFPILDSQVMAVYESPARREAARSRRNDSAQYWAAIRQDLIANRSSIGRLRRSSDDAVASLSDLRVLDILTWKIGAV